MVRRFFVLEIVADGRPSSGNEAHCGSWRGTAGVQCAWRGVEVALKMIVTRTLDLGKSIPGAREVPARFFKTSAALYKYIYIDG